MRVLPLTIALLCAATAVNAQTAYFSSTGVGAVTLPVTSIKQARLASTLLQKFDFSCGSAAIATLLTHHYDIALLNEIGYQHFVVVKGLQGDRVLLGDPAQGTRVVPREVFESQWESKLLFVIHNRMDSAHFNLAADWRVAPRAPIGSDMARAGFAGFALQKRGPGDF